MFDSNLKMLRKVIYCRNFMLASYRSMRGTNKLKGSQAESCSKNMKNLHKGTFVFGKM